MALLLPSYFASQALYSTYYLALADDYDPVKSGMSAFEEAEMDAAMALVPRDDTTKLFAVDSGTWNTAGNWYPSGVPGAGAIVTIGEGCVCTYDKDDDTTAIAQIRVDGTLKGDVTANTALLFETMVITPLGTFRDGTRAKPVQSDKVHEWIIDVSGGNIDVTFDTFFQSRGIICIGQADVWGSYKTPFLEVASPSAPAASATSLTLASAPTDWAVGDEIVICSTRAKPDTWNGSTTVAFPHESERRTLTSSSGTALGWTSGLTYSHAGPTGTTSRQDCKAYVINLTRNVKFRPSSTSVAIHHRGHMMQMHNPLGWSMRNAEVADLGRTAKHGGLAHMLSQVNASLTALDPVDMSASAYWNTDHISFGPTFRMRFTFTASGSGNLTITGTDAAGAPLEEIIAYTSGLKTLLENDEWFLTVSSITLSTTQGSPEVQILARARQLNENGVRDLHSGSAVYTAVTPVDNIQGRYPFHWHKLGITGDILLNPPVLDGCSFHGSPGWLVAHHRTHANVLNCVGFDAQGAGLVAEDGNESGLWENCCFAKFIGNSDITGKNGNDQNDIDPAAAGSPYWFTGRFVRSNGNIAIDCIHGFLYNTRLKTADALVSQFDQPTSQRGLTTTSPNHNPLEHFDLNVAVACYVGLMVIKADPKQGNDARTVLRRFKAWSCRYGAEITYTAHYTMADWDIFYGNVTIQGGKTNSSGVAFKQNTSDQIFVRPTIEGYHYALDLVHAHTANTGGPAFDTDPKNGRVIVDKNFIDCTTDYYDFDSDIDHDITSGDLNALPVAITSYTAGNTEITGTKRDEIGSEDYPYGYDFYTYSRTDLLTAYGYYVDASTNKYILMDEWYSSRYTGEIKKEIVPVDVTALVLTGFTNHGNMDLSNNTAPTFSDFSVSVVRNTAKTVDILALASGSTLRFGGFTKPMKTDLINNGDGTITIFPMHDQNYSETCYVWVDDVNGNTTRATMTINVNKRALYLGRQDLL